MGAKESAMDTRRLAMGMLAAAGLFALGIAAGCAGDAGRRDPPSAMAAAGAPAPTVKAQTLCPNLGRPIKKYLYVDAEGYRIYVCCWGCLSKVQADPKAALAKIRANGEEPEKLAP